MRYLVLVAGLWGGVSWAQAQEGGPPPACPAEQQPGWSSAGAREKRELLRACAALPALARPADAPRATELAVRVPRLHLPALELAVSGGAVILVGFAVSFAYAVVTGFLDSIPAFIGGGSLVGGLLLFGVAGLMALANVYPQPGASALPDPPPRALLTSSLPLRGAGPALTLGFAW